MTTPSLAAAPRSSRVVGPILAALLTAALYAVNLRGTFIYDDVWVAQGDTRLHDTALWGQYITDGYNNGIDNLYRPLTSISFALQWRFGHGDPMLMHLVNLILAAVNSALVAVLAQRLAWWPWNNVLLASPRRTAMYAGIIAGLLFAAHPLHVEATSYLVGRAELISTLGVLAALILYCHRPITIARAFAIAACCAVATLGKEQGLLAPLMLILAAWCSRLATPPTAAIAIHDLQPTQTLPYRPATHRRSLIDRILAFVTPGHDAPTPAERRGLLVLLILMCWGLAAYIRFRDTHLKFYWNPAFLDWSIQPMVHSVGLDRVLMPLVLLGHYTQLFLLPLKLSPDYGGAAIGWHVDLADAYLWIGLAAVLLWIAAVTHVLYHRDGASLLCLLGFAVFYGVIGNILTLIGTNFGERLFYLPSAFAIIAVAIVGARAIAGARPMRRAAFTILVLIVAVLSLRTFTYARQWNDALSFYQSAVQDQPKAVRLDMLIASEYENRHDYAAAAKAAAAGRAVLPTYSEIWLQSGIIEMRRGNLGLARQFIEEAMRRRPSVKIEGYLDELAREEAATRPATRP